MATWAWPDIAPSQVGPFLDLVEAVWETRADMARERMEADRKRQSEE